MRMIAYIHVLTPFIERGEVTLVSQAMPNFDDVPGMYVCMYVFMYVCNLCTVCLCVCMVYQLSNYVSVCMYVCVYSFFLKKSRCMYVCMYISICVFENSLKDMQVVVDVYQ